MAELPFFDELAIQAVGAPIPRSLRAILGDLGRFAKDFGAVGNNVADDTDALNAAIASAAALGTVSGGTVKGGNVFLSPGVYKTVTNSLRNTLSQSHVRLIGIGTKWSTSIIGNVNGYVIDCDDTTDGKIQGIENLHVKNLNTNQTSTTGVCTGSISGTTFTAAADLAGTFSVYDVLSGTNVTPGTYITALGNDGSLSGGLGNYTVSVSHAATGSITVTGSRKSGAIRFNDSQGGYIENCYVQGSYVGIFCYSNAYNSRIIGCDILGSLGAVANPTTIGLIAGNIEVLGCTIMAWGTGLRAANAGFNMNGSRFESNLLAMELGKDYAGNTLNLSGFSIKGGNTERNNTAIDLVSAHGGIIAGMAITGTVHVDTQINITGITTSGTTATATVPAHGLTGNHIVKVDQSVPASLRGTVLGNFDASSTTFTYTTADIGGASASTPGTYSKTPSYGMRFRNGTSLTLSGLSISVAAGVAAIDISSCSGEEIGFENIRVVKTGASIGWLMPTTNKAAFSYDNCNNPTAAMQFADLPASPIEGMEFDITNANTATLGDAVTAGGSPNTHGKVRYNGSAWTLMGK